MILVSFFYLAWLIVLVGFVKVVFRMLEAARPEASRIQVRIQDGRNRQR
jgi:hypothetical protein